MGFTETQQGASEPVGYTVVVLEVDNYVEVIPFAG